MNTNGLAQAVEKAVDAGSNYYTLSYTPTNHEWKGEYRKIQIKTQRPGLTLAYRRGYYADDPRATVHTSGSKHSGDGQASYNPLRASMLRGAPDPTEFIFAVNVRVVSAKDEPNAASTNHPGPKTTGPFRRYSVTLFISARDIPCTAPSDGVRQCSFESMIFVYDADGALLNTQDSQYKFNIRSSNYASVLQSGLRFGQEISVPVKGDQFLRIGVHDQVSDRVGAVEFPIGAVSRLTPIDTLAPAAP